MHFWVIRNLSNDQAVSKTQPEFKFKQGIANRIRPPEFPVLNPVPWDVKHTCIPSRLSFFTNKDISVFFLVLMLKSNAFHKPFEPNGDFFLQSVYLNPTHVLSWCSSALSEEGTGNELLWNWDLHCSRLSERVFVPSYLPGELLYGASN